MLSFPKSRMLLGLGKPLKFPVPTRSLASSNKPDVDPSQSEVCHAANLSGKQGTEQLSESIKPWAERLDDLNQETRLPRSVQALYLRPLRRKAQYGLPVCDLQLRSYSVRNVEFFADFAIRAAYYLKLPVSGPVPLPRIVERWTFPRSNFVHKKSQENFERITLRRLIQIKDGNPQTVQAWLAFLRKHSFYGVGLKANVWEHESLDVAKTMDDVIPEIEQSLEPHLSQFGQRKDRGGDQSILDILESERFTQNKGPLADVRRS